VGAGRVLGVGVSVLGVRSTCWWRRGSAADDPTSVGDPLADAGPASGTLAAGGGDRRTGESPSPELSRDGPGGVLGREDSELEASNNESESSLPGLFVRRAKRGSGPGGLAAEGSKWRLGMNGPNWRFSN
jgi:hypothetical protein